jgi:hypothetical protein
MALRYADDKEWVFLYFFSVLSVPSVLKAFEFHSEASQAHRGAILGVE